MQQGVAADDGVRVTARRQSLVHGQLHRLASALASELLEVDQVGIGGIDDGLVGDSVLETADLRPRPPGVIGDREAVGNERLRCRIEDHGVGRRIDAIVGDIRQRGQPGRGGQQLHDDGAGIALVDDVDRVGIPVLQQFGPRNRRPGVGQGQRLSVHEGCGKARRRQGHRLGIGVEAHNVERLAVARQGAVGRQLVLRQPDLQVVGIVLVHDQDRVGLTVLQVARSASGGPGEGQRGAVGEGGIHRGEPEGAVGVGLVNHVTAAGARERSIAGQLAGGLQLQRDRAGVALVENVDRVRLAVLQGVGQGARDSLKLEGASFGELREFGLRLQGDRHGARGRIAAGDGERLPAPFQQAGTCRLPGGRDELHGEIAGTAGADGRHGVGLADLEIVGRGNRRRPLVGQRRPHGQGRSCRPGQRQRVAVGIAAGDRKRGVARPEERVLRRDEIVRRQLQVDQPGSGLVHDVDEVGLPAGQVAGERGPVVKQGLAFVQRRVGPAAGPLRG